MGEAIDLGALAASPLYTTVLDRPGGDLADRLAAQGARLIPFPASRAAALAQIVADCRQGCLLQACERYEALANHLIARYARRVIWADPALLVLRAHVRNRQALPIVVLGPCSASTAPRATAELLG